MPSPKKIPPDQLARVRSLEDVLVRAASAGNLKKAKLALNDLRTILETYGHGARLLQNYLKLYEAALESWDLGLAKRGFRIVRQRANKRTRLYLEATALLALTHLREQDLFAAEPLMAEVLRDDCVIRSETQRRGPFVLRSLIDSMKREHWPAWRIVIQM